MIGVVIAVFDDHADGDAYLQGVHYTTVKHVLETVLPLTEVHDHILVISEPIYNITTHTYTALKPRSIEFYSASQ